MTVKFQFIPFVAFALVGVSCVGTDVGNPPGDDDRGVVSRLEFSSYSDEDGGSDAHAPGVEAAGTNGQSIPNGLIVAGSTRVEELWLAIEAIELILGPDCNAGEQRSVAGPFFVDLGRGEVYPDTPILGEEREEFCSIRLVLAASKELPTGVPAELSGQSVWLTGETALGTPIQLSSGNVVRLDYDGSSFVVDGETEKVAFIAAFDRDEWFSGIDLQGTTPVDIDDNGSPADVAAFVNQLRRDSRIVRDTDANGRVSGPEFDRPVATPRVP